MAATRPAAPGLGRPPTAAGHHFLSRLAERCRRLRLGSRLHRGIRPAGRDADSPGRHRQDLGAPGLPSQARDEIAFMDAVRADMLARWPIEPSEILVTGFSQGGSMVWDLACRAVPMARSWPCRAPSGSRCRSAASAGPSTCCISMGRPTGPCRWRDDRSATAGTRATSCRAFRCCASSMVPDPAQSERRARRHGVPDLGQCASGRELQLCEHGGGHFMPRAGSRWPTPGHAVCARAVEDR